MWKLAFIFLGGGLASLLALGQLVRRGKRRENYLLASLLMAIGLVSIYMFTVLGGLSSFPLAQSVIPVAFSIGPLFYFYLHFLTSVPAQSGLRFFVHFLPAVCSLIILIIVWGLCIQQTDCRMTEANPPRYALVMAVLHVLFYVSQFFVHFWPVWRHDLGKNRKTGHIFAVIIGSMVLGWLFLGYQLSANDDVGTVFGVALTIFFFYIYILGQRHPELVLYLVEEERKVRYEKSQIERLDHSAISEKLDHLMHVDKIYCDEELTLARLATAVGITPHQLSEFLNQVMRRNFKNYINAYRVAEAKQMLGGEPERSTLTIGLAVGFNSASAFHAAFRRETGLSPGRYRKRLAREG